MAPKTPRKRFLALLNRRPSGEVIPLPDLFFPPSALLSLVPVDLRAKIKLFPENVSIRWGAAEIRAVLGGYCLYRIGALVLLEKPNYSLATGYLILYLLYFSDQEELLPLEGIPELLEFLKDEDGRAKQKVMLEKVLPVLERMREKEVPPDKIKLIGSGDWFNHSKSHYYILTKTAADELMETLSGCFPSLKDYLAKGDIPSHKGFSDFDLRDFFSSNDEILAIADKAISSVPAGESQYRAWSTILHPDVFCHLHGKSMPERAIDTAFKYGDVHQVEMDLLLFQQENLLRCLKDILPDPASFLEKDFSALCLKKLRSSPSGADEIPITKSQLQDLNPNCGGQIFDLLSRGIFLPDLDRETLFVERRSALFFGAYSLVDALDGPSSRLPKFQKGLFDLYAFAGRFTMERGKKDRVVHHAEELVKVPQRKQRNAALFIAASLLLYLDLDPTGRDFAEVHEKIVSDLSALFEKAAKDNILDEAARLLSILNSRKLAHLLEKNLIKAKEDTRIWEESDEYKYEKPWRRLDFWPRALRQYAFLRHPIAMEVLKRIIDDLPPPRSPSESLMKPTGKKTGSTAGIWWRDVYETISRFNSPNREILLEYMAIHYPPAMSQCVHDIARSNVIPFIRKLRRISKGIDKTDQPEFAWYSRRMLRDYSTPARAMMVSEQFSGIRPECQSRTPLVFRHGCHILYTMCEGRPPSAIGKFREMPIGLARKLVSLIGEENFPPMEVRFLLIALRNWKFWPVFHDLLKHHSRYLGNEAPRDLAMFYREALLAAANPISIQEIKRELASPVSPEYRALLLECLGNAGGLGLDDLFEQSLSNVSMTVATASIAGLTASIGIAAEDRLNKIASMDKRKEVREAAIENLARIRSPHALTTLKVDLARNPGDARIFPLLAGYELPATETMMVDAIRRLAPCDRWMFYSFLLQSGGQTAIEEFHKFVGRQPGSPVGDFLCFLNKASADKAIDAWLSVAREESEDWLIPLISILKQSHDSRAIPVLLEFTFNSPSLLVRSLAANALIREADFSRSLSSIEIILSHMSLIQQNGRSARRKTYHASETQKMIEEMSQDEKILSAYLLSCKRKQVHIPAQWRDYIPPEILEKYSL
jgi:hypothetical protein